MYRIRFPDGTMADVFADELYDLPVDEIWQGRSVRDNLLSVYRYGGMFAIRNHLIARFTNVVDLSYAAEYGKIEKEKVRNAMLQLSGIAIAAAEAMDHADAVAEKPGPRRAQGPVSAAQNISPVREDPKADNTTTPRQTQPVREKPKANGASTQSAAPAHGKSMPGGAPQHVGKLTVKLVKEVSNSEAVEIIRTKAPHGLFWTRAGSLYFGIDNHRGEAWAEGFCSLEECLRWLMLDK